MDQVKSSVEQEMDEQTEEDRTPAQIRMERSVRNIAKIDREIAGLRRERMRQQEQIEKAAEEMKGVVGRAMEVARREAGSEHEEGTY